VSTDLIAAVLKAAEANEKIMKTSFEQAQLNLGYAERQLGDARADVAAITRTLALAKAFAAKGERV